LEFLMRETELKPSSPGCRIVATGQDLLVPAYAPGNVFHNSSSEGCTVQDLQLGEWAIGLICDDWYEVDKIRILQMTHDVASDEVKVQQMQAGRWIDVGEPVQTPIRERKAIFWAATCDVSICEDPENPKLTLKAGADLPQVCFSARCSEHECCKSEVVAKWSISPHMAFSGAGRSVGIAISLAAVAVLALAAHARARAHEPLRILHLEELTHAAE